MFCETTVKKCKKKKTPSLFLLRRTFLLSFSLDALSSDWDALAAGGNRLRYSSVCVFGLVGIIAVGLISTGLALEEAALLNRAASLDAGHGAVVGVLGYAGSGAVHRGREVGYVLGDGMLRADGTSIDAVALAGLGHGIVARVEVFAVLEMLGEVVGSRGQLAVEAEKSLLLRSE
jgi:hypothetical protein